MRLPLPLAAAALATLAATGSPAATRDFAARDFTQVDLKAVGDVTITPGAGFAVHAEGDPDLVSHLAPQVHHGVLILGWAGGSHWSGSHEEQLAIGITMPRVTGVAVGGAGNIRVAQASAPEFGANLAGTGSITVDRIEADRVVLAIGGAGTITISGRTRDVTAHVSGVGTIDASGLAAMSGGIAMAGSGHVHAHIEGPVAVSLSGVGDVTVDGHATCSVAKSGLGSVRCG